jgi:hypothetical protein
MRSCDLKVWRTDGSADDNDNARLIGVRAAIQGANYGSLAERITLVHDHKGALCVFHFGVLDAVEKQFIRALWAVNCEPEESVTFVSLGRGDGRYEETR